MDYLLEWILRSSPLFQLTVLLLQSRFLSITRWGWQKMSLNSWPIWISNLRMVFVLGLKTTRSFHYFSLTLDYSIIFSSAQLEKFKWFNLVCLSYILWSQNAPLLKKCFASYLLLSYLLLNKKKTLSEHFIFTQPLRSGRIWHKVNFLSGV